MSLEEIKFGLEIWYIRRRRLSGGDSLAATQWLGLVGGRGDSAAATQRRRQLGSGGDSVTTAATQRR